MSKMTQNKMGIDCDYLDFAFGGLHIPSIEPGYYVDVYEFLNFHPGDLAHEYISPNSCIERVETT